jgi:hypothetical protein
MFSESLTTPAEIAQQPISFFSELYFVREFDGFLAQLIAIKSHIIFGPT